MNIIPPMRYAEPDRIIYCSGYLPQDPPKVRFRFNSALKLWMDVEGPKPDFTSALRTPETFQRDIDLFWNMKIIVLNQAECVDG